MIFRTHRTLVALLTGLALGAGCGSDPTSWPVSGTIATSDGTCFAGVTVTLANTSSTAGTTPVTVLSDDTGKFEFASVANGTYNVTPNKAGCAFNPPTLGVIVDGGKVNSVPFTGHTAST